MEAEEASDEQRPLGLDFDSEDSGELDYFSWSDDGGDDDGWSDEDVHEEESDWGRGAAGGPGGRGKARRRQVSYGLEGRRVLCVVTRD